MFCKGKTSHAVQQSIDRGIPLVSGKILLKEFKNGKAKREGAVAGRWAYYYQEFVYITDSVSKIVLTVMTLEQYISQGVITSFSPTMDN